LKINTIVGTQECWTLKIKLEYKNTLNKDFWNTETLDFERKTAFLEHSKGEL
jgi:hypothetical protein